MRCLVCPFVLAVLLGCAGAAPGGVGSRVFVVERSSGSLAVYDLESRQLLSRRVEGLGNLQHAVMAFSRDLRFGYVASRSGQLSRVDLSTLERTGDVFTSKNSIDIAVSQDGQLLATAEYAPGGVTLLDAHSLKVVKRLPATFERDGKLQESRVTGIVDVPGNRFACVLIEGAEVWLIDASGPEPKVERRIRTATDEPYDAMITPDGRYYIVGHMGSDHVSVLDLADPASELKEVSLRDPEGSFDRDRPVKLPHLASWAMAKGHAFVPLVGQKRLAVLDAKSWRFERSLPLLGHPVYAVRAPTERHVWVSFSGEGDDAKVQVIDVERMEVVKTLDLGKRIYHMDFTPRGSHVLVSANGADKLFLVNASTFEVEDTEAVRSPSGVFGPWRAFTIGL